MTPEEFFAACRNPAWDEYSLKLINAIFDHAEAAKAPPIAILEAVLTVAGTVIAMDEHARSPMSEAAVCYLNNAIDKAREGIALGVGRRH